MAGFEAELEVLIGLLDLEEPAQWKQVGLEVDLEGLDCSEVVELARRKRADLVLGCSEQVVLEPLILVDWEGATEEEGCFAAAFVRPAEQRHLDYLELESGLEPDSAEAG